jgi:hypothetical protein
VPNLKSEVSSQSPDMVEVWLLQRMGSFIRIDPVLAVGDRLPREWVRLFRLFQSSRLPSRMASFIQIILWAADEIRGQMTRLARMLRILSGI